MTLDELRRIVDAARGPSGQSDYAQPVVHMMETLADHATALLSLLAAAEQFASSCSSVEDWAARQAIMAALDKVHEVKP